jgi:hypothetical protein
MFGNVQSQLDSQLRGIQEAGLFKSERILASPRMRESIYLQRRVS